jgi:hypothetical protein
VTEPDSPSEQPCGISRFYRRGITPGSFGSCSDGKQRESSGAAAKERKEKTRLPGAPRLPPPHPGISIPGLGLDLDFGLGGCPTSGAGTYRTDKAWPIKAANRLVARIANPSGASRMFATALLHYRYERVVEVYRKDFNRRVWLFDHVCQGDDNFGPAGGSVLLSFLACRSVSRDQDWMLLPGLWKDSRIRTNDANSTRYDVEQMCVSALRRAKNQEQQFSKPSRVGVGCRFGPNRKGARIVLPRKTTR